MNADVHALIGPYVVDALEPDERAEFERHLATCSACQEEIASLSDVATVLADAEALAPPSGLRARVLEGITQVEQVPAPPTSLETHRRRRWPRVVLAAASVLVLAAVGIGVGAMAKQRSEQLAFEKDVMMVASAPDAHSMDLDLGASHLVVSERMDAVVAMGAGAPMPADGMEYQLWLIMDDGSKMPGPTFMPDRDGEFMAMMHTSVDDVVAFAVTEEPSGGSQAPTGDMVAEVQA